MTFWSHKSAQYEAFFPHDQIHHGSDNLMALASYLAKHYLNPDEPKGEKRKSKKARRSKNESVSIADDDVSGFLLRGDEEGDDEMLGATIVEGQSVRPSRGFRKAKTSGWESVDGPKTVKKEEEDEESRKTMSNGAVAGLQSAAQVAVQVEAKRAKERRESKNAVAPGETVYRDASGRRVDASMMRAEARRKLEEAEEAKKQLKTGEVQRMAAEQRKQDLREAATAPLAIAKDDEERNRELKERQRWDDPAASFLKKKKKGAISSRTGQPLYAGATCPNRFEIRPGHRWDGVDRSNGFEKRWFKRHNEARDRETQIYAWSIDD